MSTSFKVKAGISSSQYNQQNNLDSKKSIDKQPAGLNFYRQRWNVKKQGVVQVDNGDFTFTILNVLSVTGTEDVEFIDRGIEGFSINSGITQDEFISHDLARIEFMKILQNIVTLGWKPYVEFYSDPRLLGRQSFQYALDDESYAPDPMYTPLLDEWMKLGSGYGWVFYSNNIFLDVSFRRNNSDPEKEGVYLLNFIVLTHNAHASDYFKSEDRENWKILWSDNIKKLKMMRYKKEVELIKQGYQINTQYVEPKLHPDDPVEPDSDEAKELLEYIKKHNK